jgi:16S rRNA (guanine966-N2)-methyltransferase
MAKATRPKPAKDAEFGRLRIIGGVWRSRILRFPAVRELRPTPDRVRETVFNWLAPHIEGAVCLDLFAGSGAFGFEAASRGASRVTLIERDSAVFAVLRENAQRLNAANVRVVQSDAMDWLDDAPELMDIVFLDPPYGSDLLVAAITRLAASAIVRPGGFVYLEAPAARDFALPSGWTLHRSKSAGKVGYHLAQVNASGAPVL